MKKFLSIILFFLLVLFPGIAATSGSYTTHNKFYNPDYGTSGIVDWTRMTEAFELTDGDIYNLETDVTTLSTDVTALSTLINNWAIEDNIVTMITVAVTYSDNDTFTVPGDYTSRFPAGAVVHVHVAAGMVYSTVSSSSYVAPNTTINLNDAVLTDPITRAYVVATRDGLWPNGPGYVIAADYGPPSWTALQAAVAVANASGKRLMLTPGTWPVSDNLAITAPVYAEATAIFQPATTKTLTLSNFDGTDGQHFEYVGTGTVVYDGPRPLKSIWWGTGAASVQNAINAANNGSRTIELPGGGIDFGATSVNVTKEVIIRGQGNNLDNTVAGATTGTIITYSGAGYAFYATTNTGSAYASILENFSIDCNDIGAGGLRLGNAAGSPKGFNGIVRNVAVVKATSHGVDVNYAVRALLEGVTGSYCGGNGINILHAINTEFKHLLTRYNDGIGVSLATDATSSIIGCSFKGLVAEANGYEGVKVAPTIATSIDRITFEDMWLENNQADAGRLDGYFQFLATGSFNSGSTYQCEMTLRNCAFRDVTTPWNGTTGNRQLCLSNGRWHIGDITDRSSNTQNYQSFVTTAAATLVMPCNDGVLSKWTLNPASNIEGGVTPIYSVTSLSTSGTGEDILHQYTIKKNTIGRMTLIDTVFVPAFGYGNGGIYIKAAGTKTGAAGNKTIKLYFGTAVIATIGPLNDTNTWEVEAWVMNNSNAGAQTIQVKTWNASTPTRTVIAATQDITADILVKVTAEVVDAADSVANNFFIFKRF